MWVGQKAAYERFEGDRGDLAVHCRRGQLLDCRAKATAASQPSSDRNRSRMEDTWVGWINEEQKKRLGLCIYVRFFPCLLIGNHRLTGLGLSFWTVKWQHSSSANPTSAKPRPQIRRCHALIHSGRRQQPGRGSLYWGPPIFHQARISSLHLPQFFYTTTSPMFCHSLHWIISARLSMLTSCILMSLSGGRRFVCSIRPDYLAPPYLWHRRISGSHYKSVGNG